MTFMGFWGTGVEPGMQYTESVLYCMEYDDDADDDDKELQCSKLLSTRSPDYEKMPVLMTGIYFDF